MKEHGDLIKGNHDGLKGTIAGLALGGIVGAGVMKAVGVEEEAAASSVEKEVLEELIEIEPEAQIEDEKTPVEELTPVEVEVPVEEESALETQELEPEALAEEEETPNIKESSIVPEEMEAQQGPESLADEEKAIEDEKPGSGENTEKYPEPEVIPTEPEIVAKPKVEVSTTDPAETEPPLESEAVIEEAPVEELASSKAENSVEEAVTEELTPKEEEEVESPTVEIDETLSVEAQQFERDLAAEEIISKDKSVSVESDLSREMWTSVITEQSEDNETPIEEMVEEPNPIQATDPIEDFQTTEESEVIEKVEDSIPEIVEEPISNQDTTEIKDAPTSEEEPTPEEDNVPEPSNDQPEPEKSAVIKEIPVKEEVAEDEGPKKETDGESKGDKVHGDGEIVDADESKPAEETTAVVPIEELIQDTEDKELRPNDEEKSTDEAVPEVSIESPAFTSGETLPLETDEAPTSSEKVNVPSLDENSTESHVEMHTEHEVTEPNSENPPLCEEAETEQPIEIEQKILETESKQLSDRDISSDAIEDPIEELQKENIPEPNVESETPIPELSDQSQLPEEIQDKALEVDDLDSNEEKPNEALQEESIPEKKSEEKSLESSQVNEYETEKIPDRIAEKSIEILEEEVGTESTIETEAPISSELDDQEQAPVKNEENFTKYEISEPAALDLESLEQQPSADSEDKSKSLEMRIQESSNDAQPGKNEETPIESHEEDTSEPAIKIEIPVIDSNDQEQITVKNTEGTLDLELNKPIVQELEISEEQLQLFTNSEEQKADMNPQETMQVSVAENESSTSVPELTEEIQIIAKDEDLPKSTDERTIEIFNDEDATEIQLSSPLEKDLASENSTTKPDDKNNDPTDMPESSEEDQAIIDEKEKPTSINKELKEAPSEEEVGNQSLVPKLNIDEDSEDVKAREEIAILNADMANILAKEEIKSNEMAEDTTKSEEGNSAVEAEAISGDEPKALQLEQTIEEPIDILDKQTPVENQEILEEQQEDEPVHTELIEMKEDQGSLAISDEYSSELEVKESLEKPVLKPINSEGEISHEEPEAVVVKDTILAPTEKLTQKEDITPASAGRVTESQIQNVKNEILPGESNELPIELEEPLDSESQRVAGYTEIEDLSNESSFSQAELLLEDEIQAQEAEPLPVETSVETGGNEDLSVQLKSESDIDAEPKTLNDKTIPEKSTMDIESKEPESKSTDSSIQGNSNIELKPTIESFAQVEVANQELDNEISPLEYIEGVEIDSGSQYHIKDADSVVFDKNLPVESELDHGNSSDPNESELELIRENIFNEIGSSKLVQDNNTVENSARESENVENVQLAELSHEEIPVIEGLRWDRRPVYDDVGSKILLPSNLDQDELINSEGEMVISQAQDDGQARIHQTSEVIPVEREFLRKSSIITNDNRTELMSDSGWREVPVVSENEFVRGKNTSVAPESVVDTEKAVDKGLSEDMPWDRIYKDHFESQMIPESRSQTQPIREYIAVVPESSEIYQAFAPIRDGPLTDRVSPFIEPMDGQVIGKYQDISENIPMGVKDDLMFEDNTSVYSQEFISEDYGKEQDYLSLDRSFEPTTSAKNYPYLTRLYLPNPRLHQIGDIQALQKTRLDTRSSFNYQDNDDQFNLEPENNQSNSREFYPAQNTDLSKPEYPLEQRYSSYEEFSLDIQSTLNYQDDEQSEPEPETTYTDTSYPYDQFFKPSSTRERQVNNYETEPEHPVTSTDQMTYEEHIQPILPTALTRKISTEKFPAYDESRRSPVSHGFNLGLPIRNTERVETIPENPKFEYENSAITQPQDRFRTSIPRPLDTRSFGKQPAYEEESRVAMPFDRRPEVRSGESSMTQRPLHGEFKLGRGEGSTFASLSGWEFGLGGEGRSRDDEGGSRAGYEGRNEYGYGDLSGIPKKEKSKNEKAKAKAKRRSGGGGSMY
ncbi:hypothetical protein DID88_007771 [Monilinia fructigena]|uniref:Uncharacterized protein n=1 Tax=Monilinia fructigena TaxID=38457 RepID=A0A395J3S5_9HELO|nr:hypothetical protein DID88_007771 [Monilinia fructigena]